MSKINAPSIYTDMTAFEAAQRIAKMLITSTLIPKEYQQNLPNTLIAIEVALRTGNSPLMVMQNLDIIQGRPSWRSTYVISAINSCGRFSPLEFEYADRGNETVAYHWYDGFGQNRQKKQGSITIRNITCVAYATNRSGKLMRGPEVSIAMAVREGWYTKSDSKWPTMPELMLSYRAAKFFGNLFCPDILMGMHSADEVIDITPVEQITATSSPLVDLNQKITRQEGASQTGSEPTNEQPSVTASENEEIL